MASQLSFLPPTTSSSAGGVLSTPGAGGATNPPDLGRSSRPRRLQRMLGSGFLFES